MRETKPRVLIVYFTYTQQNRTVAEAMAEAFEERGCDVTRAAIEFTDQRYVDRFSRFPLRHRILDSVHFTAAGGQVRSLISLISYLGTGENRERSLGVKIPPANLKPGYAQVSRAFANRLADSLGPTASSSH